MSPTLRRKARELATAALTDFDRAEQEWAAGNDAHARWLWDHAAVQAAVATALVMADPRDAKPG